MPNNGKEEIASLKERLLAVEDQLIVAARLTERIGSNLKDHAYLFKEFDERMNRLAERDELHSREVRERDEIMDRRIANLVTAIGSLIASQSQKS